VAQVVDGSWFRPSPDDITLAMYLEMPEEICRQIEIEDGRVVRHHSPSPNRQQLRHNLQAAPLDTVEKDKRSTGRCHRADGEIDVLFSEVPFHYRKPDALVYRCLPEDRRPTRWADKPLASDVVIVRFPPDPAEGLWFLGTGHGPQIIRLRSNQGECDRQP
jgi:hypothetical protein